MMSTRFPRGLCWLQRCGLSPSGSVGGSIWHTGQNGAVAYTSSHGTGFHLVPGRVIEGRRAQKAVHRLSVLQGQAALFFLNTV